MASALELGGAIDASMVTVDGRLYLGEVTVADGRITFGPYERR